MRRCGSTAQCAWCGTPSYWKAWHSRANAPSSPSWWIFRKCSPTAPRPSCGPNYGRWSPRSIAVSCRPSPKSSGITRPLGSATWTSCSVNSTTERRPCCISVMAERTWLYGGRLLAALREGMPPIAGGGSDLARPAAQFDRLGPLRADQHVRAIDLVEGAGPRPLMRDLLLRAADAHRQGFALHAGDDPHPRDLEQIGDVLGVVDLIEERCLVCIHVHTRDKEGLRGDRHAILLCITTV